MRKLLEAHRDGLALVIGNGIHRFNAGATGNSRDNLLARLARMHVGAADGAGPGALHGSVDKARGWSYSSGNKLFAARDFRKWPGAQTWLQPFFHKPLLFMGLGLGLAQNEVFLRWLPIERARCFGKHPGRRSPGWYVHVAPLDPGKAFFLRGVGVEPCPVADYVQIYGAPTWR